LWGSYRHCVGIDRALTISPDNPIALQAKNDFENACRKKLELSCNNFKELTGYSPLEIPQYVNKLLDDGTAAFNKHDWDEAIKITSEILKLDPNNSVAYANRSGAFANKKMLKESLGDGNISVRLNPDLAIGYQNRGYALELMGNKKDAALDYEIACRLKLEIGCSSLQRFTQ